MRALHQYLNKVLRHPFLLRPVGVVVFCVFFIILFCFCFVFSSEGPARRSRYVLPVWFCLQRSDILYCERGRDQRGQASGQDGDEGDDVPTRTRALVVQPSHLFKSSSIGWKKKFTKSVNGNDKPHWGRRVGFLEAAVHFQLVDAMQFITCRTRHNTTSPVGLSFPHLHLLLLPLLLERS